jgi:hypothetical protein
MVFAQDDPMKLRGLTRLYVFVPPLRDDFEKQGLRVSIQTDAELRLRQAGVAVVNATRATNDVPYLEIQVTSTERRSDVGGLIAYQVQAFLHEPVRVQRAHGSISMIAITWESNVFTGSLFSDIAALRAHVRDRIDEFINGYLAANPRR